MESEFWMKALISCTGRFEQNDPANWREHIDEELIAANDGPFKQQLDRYKYPGRYDLKDGSDHRDAALVHLHALND